MTRIIKEMVVNGLYVTIDSTDAKKTIDVQEKNGDVLVLGLTLPEAENLADTILEVIYDYDKP